MKPSLIFETEDCIQICVYGGEEARAVAERVVPMLQELLTQGMRFARDLLRAPYECELHSVSVYDPNEMGEEIVLHCSFDQEDCGAMPGDLSMDFAFVCGGARWSEWKMPPKCVRFSVRVS